MDYRTKDSGIREEFDSGMVRDTQEGKARFDLLFPLNIPYSEQLLTRAANLMERGMAKYGERNWEKANSPEEYERAASSALRHMMQWYNGETDEDHASAVIFNLMAAEAIASKMRERPKPTSCLNHNPNSWCQSCGKYKSPSPEILPKNLEADPALGGSCSVSCGTCYSDGCGHHSALI